MTLRSILGLIYAMCMKTEVQEKLLLEGEKRNGGGRRGGRELEHLPSNT